MMSSKINILTTTGAATDERRGGFFRGVVRTGGDGMNNLTYLRVFCAVCGGLRRGRHRIVWVCDLAAGGTCCLFTYVLKLRRFVKYLREIMYNVILRNLFHHTPNCILILHARSLQKSHKYCLRYDALPKLINLFCVYN